MEREDYSGYKVVVCRQCQQLGIFIDRAMQPVVGVTLGGDYILHCGHQQDDGRVKQPAVAPPVNGLWDYLVGRIS